MKAKFTEITGPVPKRLTVETDVIEESDMPDFCQWEVVGVYPDFKYQTFDGFGTALTDSACYLLSRMQPEEKEKTLKAWFGKSGIDARYIRASIDSCDYSLDEYQAVADPLTDPELKTFSIARDKKYVVPAIKEAISLSGENIGIMLSPWSPPYQWKTPQMEEESNGIYDETSGIPSRNRGGSLKPEYYGPWAKYIVKYIKAYLDEGIPVTMLTIQNELRAINSWDSCYWTSEQQKVFLRDHLYPEMLSAGLIGNVKILVWDYNKEHLLQDIAVTADDDTVDMIDGIAFHWYTGDHFDVLRMAHEKYPGLLLIHSESCALHVPAKEQDQADAGRYAHHFIGNLNNGMHAFIDWNMTVDRTGGPRHVPGGFSAPLITEDDFTLTKTLSYEYLKLISETIVPGSVVIGSSSFTKRIEQTAVRRPDGSIGVILFNNSDREEKIYLLCSGKVVIFKTKPNSLNSMII